MADLVPHGPAPAPSGRVVAVAGHESDGGRALRTALGERAVVVAGGRELLRCVGGLRADGERVCVVPMTLGRDAELVADAARTLRALPAEHRADTVLADAFGTAGHLVGWLRAAALRVPERHALLVTAPAAGPFDDAELFRIARLVWQYGRHRTVEVALSGGDPDPARGVRRCLALGADRVALLPAGWAPPEVPDPEHAEPAGPLLTPAAVAGVLDARVRDAWRRWDELGDDGTAAGLAAAHDHQHGHDHGHEHEHEHGQGRAPGHTHQRDQDRDRDHGCDHGPDHASDPAAARRPAPPGTALASHRHARKPPHSRSIR